MNSRNGRSVPGWIICRRRQRQDRERVATPEREATRAISSHAKSSAHTESLLGLCHTEGLLERGLWVRNDADSDMSIPEETERETWALGKTHHSAAEQLINKVLDSSDAQGIFDLGKTSAEGLDVTLGSLGLLLTREQTQTLLKAGHTELVLDLGDGTTSKFVKEILEGGNADW